MSETESIQIKPLNQQVAGIWEYAWSDYPDAIKIPMEDGRIVTYRREVEQPEPRVMDSVRLIREMNRLIRENTYGGGKHIKKTGERCERSAGR